MGLSWTREHDRVLGPFLYAREKRGGKWAALIDSGCDEYPGATLRFGIPGHTFMVAMPQWLLQPHRVKVFPKDWNNGTPEATEIVARLGRNWYWDISRREYGVSCSEGFLQLFLGRQTHDSSTTQQKSWFLPWTQWRFMRTSHYTPEHVHIRTFPEVRRTKKQPTVTHDSWQEEYDWRNALPTVDFAFADFDGEKIVAKCRIEEREWRFGQGSFAWLSLFRKPKISRSLDLHFTAEVGKRKGSWKGGTLGHSCDIASGETPESAFRKYCAKQNLTFIGPASEATP